MNLHDWIDELSDVLDIEVEIDESLVLDVAKEAAHNVERPAAPISTFLLGYALAQAGGSAEELERLASEATDLALRWDQPAAADDDQESEDDPDDEPGEDRLAGEIDDDEDD